MSKSAKGFLQRALKKQRLSASAWVSQLPLSRVVAASISFLAFLMPRRTPYPVDSHLHIRTTRAEKIDNHRRKMVLCGQRRAAKHRGHGHDRTEDPVLPGSISLGTAPFFDSSRLLSGSAERFDAEHAAFYCRDQLHWFVLLVCRSS
jgi:hypothetical protein